jgi:uncharacterized membrane protein YeaQ/YmgE (transglycosylase-associated protein family)
MNMIELSLTGLVAIICGTIAQLTSSNVKGGWIVHPVIGFFGGLVGVYISRSLNAPVVYNLKIGMVVFPIVYCLIGAVIFLAAIGLFVKPAGR